MQLLRPDLNLDFVGKRRIAGLVSALLVLASVLLFVFKGPNWGIDFTGGTEIVLKFQQPVDIAELRTALTAIGLSDDSVQRINDPEDNEFSVRIQQAGFGAEDMKAAVLEAASAEFGPDWVLSSRLDAQVGALLVVEYRPPEVPVDDVRAALTRAGVTGVEVRDSTDENTVEITMPGLTTKVEQAIGAALTGKPFEVLSVDSVGPKVGGELRRQSFIALGATLVLILLYVGLRFDLSFAPGAVLALFHDVAITVGVFVLLGREFNVSMIGALLTIIGYSLNDTIVIYDRIRENLNKYRRKDLPTLINNSINETLGRTAATSITTLMAILAFLWWGGPVINNFALAMFIGVIAGSYSTWYVASPFILVMEPLKPHLTRLITPVATGVQAEGGGTGTPSP